MLGVKHMVGFWLIAFFSAIVISFVFNVFIGVMFMIAVLISLVFYMRKNNIGMTNEPTQITPVKYMCLNCSMIFKTNDHCMNCGSRMFKAVF